MTQHCLPFVYDPQMGRVLDSEGTPVCMVYSKNEQANARFIVQACNNFDDLLLALQRVAAYLSIHDPSYWQSAEKLRAAIAKATSPQATKGAGEEIRL